MNSASVRGNIITCKYAFDKTKKLAFHKTPVEQRINTAPKLRPLTQNPHHRLGRQPMANLQNIVESALKQSVRQVLQSPGLVHAIGQNSQNRMPQRPPGQPS